MKKADNFYLRTNEENDSDDFEIDEDDEIWNGSQTITFERMSGADGSFQGFAHSDNYKTATLSEFDSAILEREIFLRSLDPFMSHHKLVLWKNARNIDLNKTSTEFKELLYIFPPRNKNIFTCGGDYVSVENVIESPLSSYGPMENPVADVRGPCRTGIEIRNNLLKECLRIYESKNDKMKKPETVSDSSLIIPYKMELTRLKPEYQDICSTYGFQFIEKSVMELDPFVDTVKDMFSRFYLKKQKNRLFQNNKSIRSSGILSPAKFKRHEYVIKTTKCFKSIIKAKDISSWCEATLCGSQCSESEIPNRSLTYSIPEHNSVALSGLISKESVSMLSPFRLERDNILAVEAISNALSEMQIRESYFTASTSQQHLCSRTYTIERHNDQLIHRHSVSELNECVSRGSSEIIPSSCLQILKPKNKPHTFSCPNIFSAVARAGPCSISLSSISNPYSDEELAAIQGSFLEECERARSIPELLKLCNQDKVIPFSLAYDWRNCALRKISQGSYGDVYMISHDETTVLKIMPIASDSGEVYIPRTYKHIVSEMKVAQCMSNLKDNEVNSTINFCRLERLVIVKGCYPSALLDAWQEYEEKYRTFKRQPDYFALEQFYVVFEVEHGGSSLTYCLMEDAVIAESVLKQVTVSLAIAEEMHHFEHRDLHLGNILVQPTTKEFIRYILRGKVIVIPSHGILVKIIDFTLSHITTSSGTTYYHDLAQDLELFQQTGDIQYDVYRNMKAHLQNDWEKTDLYSNVLWLSFLCGKLLEFNFKRPGSLQHENCVKRMEMYKVMLMKSKSALDFLIQSQILCQPCTGDYYASHGPIH